MEKVVAVAEAHELLFDDSADSDTEIVAAVIIIATVNFPYANELDRATPQPGL